MWLLRPVSVEPVTTIYTGQRAIRSSPGAAARCDTGSFSEAVRSESPLLGNKMAQDPFKVLERLGFGFIAPTDAGMSIIVSY